MTDVQRTLFGFGLGYSTLRLAQRLKPQPVGHVPPNHVPPSVVPPGSQGWRISGTVRSKEKATALRGLGISAQVWSGAGKPLENAPPHGAHWIISTPPDEWGCPAFLAAGALAGTASSITYLSTSGVYGDHAGSWVFETTEPKPGSPRAHARLLAEQQWQSVRSDISIVRLPGIYGPGRSAIDRLRAGNARRIVKPGQVFSRVHVDDIASGLAAILRRPMLGGIFHLCDDHPAPPQDVITHAASLLNIDPPPEIAFEDAELSAMARSFYAECKRLSNAHTKSVLRWTPTYPTFTEGLASILAEEAAPGPT